MKKAASLLLAVLIILSCAAMSFADTPTPDLSEYSDDELISLLQTVCTEIAERKIPQKAIIESIEAGKQSLHDYIDSFTFDDDKKDSGSDRAASGDAVTPGMKNALRSAKSYLRFSAFSHPGLIDQLKYEGYSQKEATYAADNCGADWNEQAEKSAKSYLETMAFSRSSLIEQLEYEGFTHDQAVYGVDKAY